MAIVRALRSGDKIAIRSFGSFRTRQRKSRTSRNPQTGAHIAVPAKKILYFTPSNELNALVNTPGTGQQEPAPALQPALPRQSTWSPRADRVPFRYPVQLILESGRRQSARTLNISQSGLLVEAVLPIKAGSHVRISAKELPFLCIGASIRRCVRRWLLYQISLEFDALLTKLF